MIKMRNDVIILGRPIQLARTEEVADERCHHWRFTCIQVL